jgi:hypothetical protein
MPTRYHTFDRTQLQRKPLAERVHDLCGSPKQISPALWREFCARSAAYPTESFAS